MPNRIIKESICTSETVAQLSDFEFRLWIGLITQADDAGRCDARAAIIKGHVFPLRERVTIKDIDNALHALADKGCVSLYTVGGKPYLYFPSWAEHQRIRDCKPKFPAPESDDLTVCGNLPQPAAESGFNTNPNTNNNNNSLSLSACARVEPTIVDVARYFEQSGLKKTDALKEAQKFIEFNASRSWDCLKKCPWEQTAENWLARKEEHEEAV